MEDIMTSQESQAVQPEASLYAGLTAFEEQIVPKLQALAKTLTRLGRLKSIEQQADKLNLMEIPKLLLDVTQLSADAGTQALGLQEILGQFQIAPREVDQMEWTRAFMAECANLGNTVDGEYPQFRVFPVDVKVDFAHHQVQMNNRTVRVLHPKAVAALVNNEVAKLYKERFNPILFMRAVIRVYEVLLAERQVEGLQKGNRNVARSVSLRQIHNLLSVRTGTSGYTAGQFAFDIYRLRTESDLVCDGRRLMFESTRNATGAVVIPLPGGQKENIGSLEILEVDGDDDGQA